MYRSGMKDVSVTEYLAEAEENRQLTSIAKKNILRLKDLNEEGAINDPTKKDVVAQSMRLTHSLRHQNIFRESFSVKNVITIYPGLKNFQELGQEFQRVTKVNVDEFKKNIICGFKQCKDENEWEENPSCDHAYCTEAFRIIREDNQNTVPRMAAITMAYGCVMSETRWANETYKVFKSLDDPIPKHRYQPFVALYSSPFEESCANVICEGVVVLENVNFFEAVISCYFLYYVFNMQYHSIDAEIFEPFDEVKNFMAEEAKQRKKSKNADEGKNLAKDEKEDTQRKKRKTGD